MVEITSGTTNPVTNSHFTQLCFSYWFFWDSCSSCWGCSVQQHSLASLFTYLFVSEAGSWFIAQADLNLWSSHPMLTIAGIIDIYSDLLILNLNLLFQGSCRVTCSWRTYKERFCLLYLLSSNMKILQTHYSVDSDIIKIMKPWARLCLLMTSCSHASSSCCTPLALLKTISLFSHYFGSGRIVYKWNNIWISGFLI